MTTKHGSCVSDLDMKENILGISCSQRFFKIFVEGKNVGWQLIKNIFCEKSSGHLRKTKRPSEGKDAWDFRKLLGKGCIRLLEAWYCFTSFGKRQENADSQYVTIQIKTALDHLLLSTGKRCFSCLHGITYLVLIQWPSCFCSPYCSQQHSFCKINLMWEKKQCLWVLFWKHSMPQSED